MEVHGGSLDKALGGSGLARLASLVRGVQTELGKTSLDGGACEPAKKGLSGRKVGCGAKDHGALADWWVAAGEGEVCAGLTKVRAGSDGERDQSGLRVAGIGELGGLEDVLPEDEFGGKAWKQVEGLQFGRGSLAVGSVAVIGDGDTAHTGAGQRSEGEGLRG